MYESKFYHPHSFPLRYWSSFIQSYLNPNGLKYHLEKGTCKIETENESEASEESNLLPAAPITVTTSPRLSAPQHLNRNRSSHEDRNHGRQQQHTHHRETEEQQTPLSKSGSNSLPSRQSHQQYQYQYPHQYPSTRHVYPSQVLAASSPWLGVWKFLYWAKNHTRGFQCFTVCVFEQNKKKKGVLYTNPRSLPQLSFETEIGSSKKSIFFGTYALQFFRWFSFFSFLPLFLPPPPPPLILLCLIFFSLTICVSFLSLSLSLFLYLMVNKKVTVAWSLQIVQQRSNFDSLLICLVPIHFRC